MIRVGTPTKSVAAEFENGASKEEAERTAILFMLEKLTGLRAEFGFFHGSHAVRLLIVEQEK